MRRVPAAAILHGLRRGVAVVGDRVRQDHRVDLGVRQVERAAQRVTELVVEAHAAAPSTVPASQRAVVRVRPRLEVGGSRTTTGSARASARMPLLSHQRDDRVGAFA